MKHRLNEFCYVVLLGVVVYAWVLIVVSLLCPAAKGAEPNRHQRVRVSVKTDITINSGYGIYLGKGLVAVEKHITQGSRGGRAKITFAEGQILRGSIVSEDKRRGVDIIKLDRHAAPPTKFERTRSFYYRQMSYTKPTSNLPPGTPTQLALISAIRAHPDAPASTDGMCDPMLAKEAESHSLHQARIQSQGHHNWDRRFRRINAALPSGFTAIEVCAESWPGQTLVEAATECVNSWRQSPGHWKAVSEGHPLYGYDMKRGRNGIWYATGIFGQD